MHDPEQHSGHLVSDRGDTKPVCDLGESDHRCPRCGDDFISWACELVCWNCGLKFTCDE